MEQIHSSLEWIPSRLKTFSSSLESIHSRPESNPSRLKHHFRTKLQYPEFGGRLEKNNFNNYLWNIIFIRLHILRKKGLTSILIQTDIRFEYFSQLFEYIWTHVLKISWGTSNFHISNLRQISLELQEERRTTVSDKKIVFFTP